jgi:hypothetical protein
MRPSYAAKPSPDRLRRASLLAISLAGAATGLLGGLGWRLFADDARRVATAIWLLASLVVAALLLLAGLARALAAVVERGTSQYRGVLEGLEDRLGRLEREMEALHDAPAPVTQPGCSGEAGPAADTLSSPS